MIKNRTNTRMVYFDELSFDLSSINVPRTFFFDYDKARARLEAELIPKKKPWVEPSVPATRVHYESDEALRALMEEFMRGFPNHLDNYELWRVVRSKFRQRGFDLPEYIRYDPLFPVLQAAFSAKLGRPVGSEQKYLIQLANTLFNTHKHALWVFTVMMTHYDRGALFRERGDQVAWKKKVREYREAWSKGSEEFRPDARHLDLVQYLFPEAEDQLSEDPRGYMTRRRSP
jgi:hypothetical protein